MWLWYSCTRLGMTRARIMKQDLALNRGQNTLNDLVCLHPHTHARTQTYKRAYVRVRTKSCLHVCTSIYIYTHIYIYICIRANIFETCSVSLPGSRRCDSSAISGHECPSQLRNSWRAWSIPSKRCLGCMVLRQVATPGVSVRHRFLRLGSFAWVGPSLLMVRGVAQAVQ